MLTPLVALPLLLATALDAPAAAPTRLRVGPSLATIASLPQRPPAPSLESSLRLPEPVLRRTWCAEGSEMTRADAAGLVGRGTARHMAMALREGRIQRLKTRGPPRRRS